MRGSPEDEGSTPSLTAIYVLSQVLRNVEEAYHILN